jgi:hypothetical protein
MILYDETKLKNLLHKFRLKKKKAMKQGDSDKIVEERDNEKMKIIKFKLEILYQYEMKTVINQSQISNLRNSEKTKDNQFSSSKFHIQSNDKRSKFK